MTAFRDAARRVLEARLPTDDPKWAAWIEGTLDELDGCVQPQTIDRDALVALIVQDSEYESWSAEGLRNDLSVHVDDFWTCTACSLIRAIERRDQ